MTTDDGREDTNSSAVDREIEYHLDRTTEEFIAAGHTPDNARRLALQRFGDLAYYRKRILALHRTEWRLMSLQSIFERILDDIRFGIRYARRSPALTLGVAATIALGVGANAMMYSVVDRILLTPPPHIEHASQVKRVFVESEFRGQRFVSATVTHPDVEDWYAAESFATVAAFSQETMTLGTGESSRRLPAVYVTHDFFPLLGTPPHLGRLFTPEDDAVGAEPVAVLGYDFWQREFGGRRDVLGTLLELGHARYRVIGVVPPGFTGVDLERVDLWLPLFSKDDVNAWRHSRGYYHLHVIARLAPGVDDATAAAEATLLHRQGRAGDRDLDPNVQVRTAPLLLARGPRASSESVVATWLAGVSLFVLLIACSNVANLLLAHGARQRREIAVRLALGVNRGRLVWQLLVGSFVFAVLGGLGALVIARAGGSLVGRVLLPDVDWSSGVINIHVLTFTIGIALLASVSATVVPAVRSSRCDLMSNLTYGARGASARRSRLRWFLLVVQAALSTVLLVGSGLFVKSLNRIRGVDLGFDPSDVYVIRMDLPQRASADPWGIYDSDDRVVMEAHQRALERLQQAPFVEGASVTNTVPFANSLSLDLRVSGADSAASPTSGGPYALAVTPDYFSVMGVDLIRGRSINAGDVIGSPYVAVVAATMARSLWPNMDAIGQCLFILEQPLYPNRDLSTPPCTEVVGIAEDTRRQGVIESEQFLYYLSASQYPLLPRGLMVRTTMPEERVVQELRSAVFSVVPEARFVQVASMTSLVSPDYRSWQLGASVFTGFGVLALVVAAVGLYSVLAFDVAQRRTEIGVRSALGATDRRLISWIVREGLSLAIIGLLLGGGAAAVLGGTIQTLLYETSARDPFTYGTVALVLLVVAVLASLIPAWRAARVEPVEALKAE